MKRFFLQIPKQNPKPKSMTCLLLQKFLSFPNIETIYSLLETLIFRIGSVVPLLMPYVMGGWNVSFSQILSLISSESEKSYQKHYSILSECFEKSPETSPGSTPDQPVQFWVIHQGFTGAKNPV